MIKKTLTLSFIVFQLVLTEFHLVIFLFLCEHQQDAPSTNFPIFQCCQHCFQYSDVANIVFNISELPRQFSIFQCCQHCFQYIRVAKIVFNIPMLPTLFSIFQYCNLLYRAKELIQSETELSVSLWVLRLKFVFY